MSNQPRDPVRFSSIAQSNAPEVGDILNRIDADVRLSPGSLVPLFQSLADRLAMLTTGIPFDPRAPIDGVVDLDV